MKLTVLGNNGPYPSAGGACSGYLLSNENANILVDCGNGVLSNLQKLITFEEIDAIILTHLHSDHISDMMVLKYAIQIKRKRGQFGEVIPVYAPPEPADEYNRLDVKDAFSLQPITGEMTLDIKGIKIRFEKMKHPSLDFAVSFEYSGKRLVFSGDTSWNDNIIGFTRNADIVMLDAGLLARDKTDENVPHLTAEECGIIAKKADVSKLLLTHFWPEYDIDMLVNEAKANFDNVEAVSIFHEYNI
jgi:Metal-dependent hydrolases of the beta-lactamase superfamily III